jgi:hypothetical protein
MNKRTWVLLMGCLLLSPLAFAGKVYKWVDSQGNVHYGERPPSTQQADELRIRSHAPSGSATPASKPQSANEFLDSLDKERQEKAEASEKSAKEKEITQKQCERARKQMATLNVGGRMFEMQADGERKYLDDADIQRRKKEAQAAIDKWCK